MVTGLCYDLLVFKKDQWSLSSQCFNLREVIRDFYKVLNNLLQPYVTKVRSVCEVIMCLVR